MMMIKVTYTNGNKIATVPECEEMLEEATSVTALSTNKNDIPSEPEVGPFLLQRNNYIYQGCLMQFAYNSEEL